MRNQGRMKRFKSTVFMTLAAIMAVTSVIISMPMATAHAADGTGSSSLSIAPKKTYVIDPGGSAADTILIRNIDSKNELTLNLSVVDFTYRDDSGSPKLMLDSTTEPTTWSLRPYLTTPKSVTIKANGSASVPIKVTIPSKLGAGSYYSAIMYSTGAPTGGNVGLSASGVTLVFANVPGQVKENLVLKKFGAYDKTAKKYRMFTSTEPSVMGYTLENTGNVTEAPVGTVKLRDMWGHEYVINEVNPVSSLALIGQTRTFQACVKLNTEAQKSEATTTDSSTCVSPGMWPGFYSASIDLFYGQNGNNTKEVTGTAFFFYLPLWFIVLVIVVLLALALAIWRLVVALKRKTRTPSGRRSSRMMRR